MARILVIDNYDSFVYNLVQYLLVLGADCQVRRNDEVGPADVVDCDGVLISPGPGAPEDAGVSVPMVSWCADSSTPVLGVCLGLQAIAVAFGAVVDRAPTVVHGKTSRVSHDGVGLFTGLPNPVTATRYHSLAVVPESVPPALTVSARTDEGVIMGLRHRSAPVEGVQFHPESVLTECGHRMLGNWLEACGDLGAAGRF